MTHFAGVETISLPASFAEALLSEASCEAVVVESTGRGEPVGSAELGRRETGRRGSVVLFQVGRAYVAQIVGAEDGTRTLGLAPAEAEAYVDRAVRDDGWTVLTVEGALSIGQRGASGAEIER